MYYVARVYNKNKGIKGPYYVRTEDGRVVLSGLSYEAARAFADTQNAMERNWEKFLKGDISKEDI